MKEGRIEEKNDRKVEKKEREKNPHFWDFEEGVLVNSLYNHNYVSPLYK